MRILFTFVGGAGHFDPLIPIARAATAMGHTVAVAGRAAMVPNIESAGFTAFASPGEPEDPSQRIPVQELSAEREALVLRHGFADRLARERYISIQAVCAHWHPDVIVCDEIDFGSMLAAEQRGIPHASVLVIAAGSFVRPDVVADPLIALRTELGLQPDPDLRMLSRHLVLSPIPVSFRDPGFPLPATAHLTRPFTFDAAAPRPEPSWRVTRPDAPTVYCTLGTIFNIESGDLFGRVLTGLRDLPINLVVTVGRQIDPAELGPQPDHVHVERYIPQADVLPHCDLVLSHGGSGSVVGALAHGRPMVMIPLGADQPLNAGRGVALGLSRTLDAMTVTPDAVTAAVADVLADSSRRAAAVRVRDEIAAMPPPEAAVTRLVALGANPG